MVQIAGAAGLGSQNATPSLALIVDISIASTYWVFVNTDLLIYFYFLFFKRVYFCFLFIISYSSFSC